MDVLPAHLNRDSFRDSFKGLVALEIIIDLPFGFPINNIISHLDFFWALQVSNPDRQRFSVPRPSRYPDILVDNKLINENFFHLIQNPPETGVVRVFENPEEWDTSKGSVKSITTQGEATIQMTSSPLHLD